MQGYDSPNRYDGSGNSPDLQDVYGNVIAIDTSVEDYSCRGSTLYSYLQIQHSVGKLASV